MKRVIVTALAVVVLSPSPAPAQALQEPPCAGQFTQHQYAHYARAVFKRRTISRRAHSRLVQMRACQHSPQAHANTVRLTRKLRRARWRREHYWEWRREQLSSAQTAMLARLRGCETRGLAFPSNYRQRGHHRGAYQYDFATWGEAGGSGDPADASPAEQDVRTAAFYPSHRGRWACSA